MSSKYLTENYKIKRLWVLHSRFFFPSSMLSFKRRLKIHRQWLPYFANYRRSGYDFDSRYEDGLATYREKVIMDYYIGEDGEGDILWKQDAILSTELWARSMMWGFCMQDSRSMWSMIRRALLRYGSRQRDMSRSMPSLQRSALVWARSRSVLKIDRIPVESSRLLDAVTRTAEGRERRAVISYKQAMESNENV